MNLRLPWGEKDFLNITLPLKWSLRKEFFPDDSAPSAELKDMLIESLANPIDQGPLYCQALSDKKIAIIVDDNTRPTPVHLIFPKIIEELHIAGASKKNISIIISLGTHSPLSEAEIANRLGVDRLELKKYTIVNHDCHNREMLFSLGKTLSGAEVLINKEACGADLVISIGTIEPHLLAGFGGGLKNIIPGCAGMETISATHLQVPADKRFTAVGKMGEECPTRLLIEEGAGMLSGEIFLVNTVLNRKGEAVGIYCGNPIKAHRAGCRLAAKVYGIGIDEKADVVITGSHPMDMDLRQGTKCLSNVAAALKDNGLLIAFLRCNFGIGDMTIPDYFLPLDLMRIFSQECGTEKIVEIRGRCRESMSMDDKYMLQFLTEMCKRQHILVYAPDILVDTGSKLGTFELFSEIDPLFNRATELVPEAKTVLAFPYGGVSYAFS
ncbi:MAG: nickel-dependent lactate racemase [Dehalobacterium sp.]